MSEREAGRELDAMVAEKVMGWRWVQFAPYLIRSGSGRGRMLRPPVEQSDEFTLNHMVEADMTAPLYRHGKEVHPLARTPNEWLAAVPAYSTDIKDAWEVEETLRERGLSVVYAEELARELGADKHDRFRRGFEYGFANGAELFALIHATPEQRCRAALKAAEEVKV